ncbi:LytR/AlgR family response regulator transcription factor [Chitinophaga japonensis]|uniref:LytTR family two component transcriptional regulator n=1 Tax=Chitinophaga japonensis TaxID=104662 RepID=A0A562T031_CHIJA|nr:LytTR family DNA-binding domain-containing protein [Chitinophaga japonensis]TWI86360.1 LytTR family two component transcriptional regulator [Chitinophaga japonensis]
MEVLIIEDEEPAAERLVGLLRQYDARIRPLAILSSVEEVVKWFGDHRQPDLVLLDIHLSDGLCFDIFKQVAVRCPIIFCTAYDQYVLDAFQVHSIDYLLKPVQYQKLEKSLRKMEAIRSQMRPPGNDPHFNEIIQIIRTGRHSYKSRFMVKTGNRIKAVKSSDIAYFNSRNKVTLLVTRDGQRFPLDYTLDELMTMLDPVMFFHVNRNLVIHIDSVKEVHPYFKGRLKLLLSPEQEEEIVISSQKTPLFKAWLDH